MMIGKRRQDGARSRHVVAPAYLVLTTFSVHRWRRTVTLHSDRRRNCRLYAVFPLLLAPQMHQARALSIPRSRDCD